FLNTRSDVARRIEGITCDGVAALIQGSVPGRRDVVMVACRSLAFGDDAYRLSERGDLSIRHRTDSEVEIMVLDTESGKPALVNFPTFAPAWEFGPVDVLEWTDGQWRRSVAQVQSTRTGLQLGRASPGIVYRLRLAG